MKYIFTITIMILSSFSSFAQTEFAPLGAQWTYKGHSGGVWGSGSEWIKTYQCVSDTTEGQSRFLKIQDITKSQSYTYNYAVSQIQYFNRSADTSFIELKTTPDTIFYLNPIFERYTPLFIFNVAVGDTFSIPITDTMPLSGGHMGTNTFVNPDGDSIITFIVDSIVSKNFGGTLIETFYVRTLMAHTVGQWTQRLALFPQFNWSVEHINNNFSGNDTVNMSGAYTRLFGGVGAGILPVQFGTYFNIDAPHRMDKLCNFSSDSLSIVMNENCDTFRYNTPLSLKSAALSKNLKIYPNPAQNTLHIDLEKPTKNIKIKIINLLGSAALPDLLIKEQLNSVDISTLNPGIHLMILENEGERYYHKFVKQ